MNVQNSRLWCKQFRSYRPECVSISITAKQAFLRILSYKCTDICLLIGLCKVKRPFWWAHLNVWEVKFSDEVFQWTPHWNCQWKEWTLCWSMSSMRPHLKWSAYEKILNIWEVKFSDEVFWWTPHWNFQWKEWTLCWSMMSMRPHLKQSTYKNI